MNANLLSLAQQALGGDFTKQGGHQRSGAGAIRRQEQCAGYTDKTGDVAKNEELAKSRASAVRDALQAAGVDAANIEMKPPMFVELGSAGGDAEARRVEISRQ